MTVAQPVPLMRATGRPTAGVLPESTAVATGGHTEPPSAGVVHMHGRYFPVGDMCWRRTFPGVPPEARRARDFVAFLIEGFTRADDVVLAAAEMVANALQHTRSAAPGGLFLVEVRRWRGGVALTVIDQGGPNDPSPRSLRESEGWDDGVDGLAGGVWDLPESGRGLLTISATATWWDWCGGPGGRTLTAVFQDHRAGTRSVATRSGDLATGARTGPGPV